MYSQAQNKATQKYNAKSYDQIKIVVPKGEREVYKKFAETQNKSLNSLFRELMKREMNEKGF